MGKLTETDKTATRKVAEKENKNARSEKNVGGTGGLEAKEDGTSDGPEMCVGVSREPPDLTFGHHHGISASESLRVRIRTSSFLNTLPSCFLSLSNTHPQATEGSCT